MKSDAYQPLVHRFAVLTACVALLPIVIGALVTTMNAGMAFRDWPTSDGHNMFAYPWLQSAGAKFVEHGHRLAGMLIGFVSIAFVAVVWAHEPRRWVRVAATGVLLCVIAQGLLGGGRVRLDDRVLAMLHGSFAALVFAFMTFVALATSRGWHDVARLPNGNDVRRLIKPLAVLTAILIYAQYLLGGTLRHLGMSLYEHIGLAALVLLAIAVLSVASLLSQTAWLRRPACVLMALVIVQVLLGVASFVTKFGFAPSGYVAVHDSLPQILFRTAHTVTGMLLFSTSVLITARVFRLDSLSRRANSLSREPSGERALPEIPAIADVTVRGAVR